MADTTMKTLSLQRADGFAHGRSERDGTSCIQYPVEAEADLILISQGVCSSLMTAGGAGEGGGSLEKEHFKDPRGRLRLSLEATLVNSHLYIEANCLSSWRGDTKSQVILPSSFLLTIPLMHVITTEY